MVQILENVIQDAEVLLRAGLAVLALAMIGAVWVRTRSLMPVLGAVLLSAVVLYAVNNMTFLQREVQEDVNNYSEGRTARGGR
jgi:hypothetical protein